MKFQKYKLRGAYHWDEYKKRTAYGQHADYLASIVREGKTLDIGAGDGLITYLTGAEGIDDNKLAVKLAQEKGVNVELGDAYDLSKYDDESFDNVLMADVIEHLEFPDRVLTEIYRVLKQGGKLYITTPPAKKFGMHDPKYHYREYTQEELKELVELFDFKLDKLITKNNFVRMYAIFSCR